VPVSAPRAGGPIEVAVELPAGEPRPAERSEPVEAPHHGLVKQAPRIDPVLALPEGVRTVRRATPEDAEAIAELQARCHLSNIEDDPRGGWLLQQSTPEAIRAAMKLDKDFWIAESDEGKVVAFQIVTPARLISRPAAQHKFLGRFAERAERVLASGRFIYMSQIAVDREFRGKKLAPAMQERVLERYQKYSLVAHVGVCTQRDFDEWKDGPFEPASNNVASHVHHQRQGYRLVAYTSDLADTSYNSGLAPPGAEAEMPAVLGAMYIHFRDGAESLPFAYVDPVEAVLGAPVARGDIESTERSFSEHWPETDGFKDTDPTWSEDRTRRYELAKQRLELLFLREPDVR
jgi:ribosomal protein S18 acetylase RimI-like enzyme